MSRDIPGYTASAVCPHYTVSGLAWQSRPCDHLDVTFPVRTPCAPDLMPAEASSFQCTPALQPGSLRMVSCLPGNEGPALVWEIQQTSPHPLDELYLHQWGLRSAMFKTLLRVGPSFQPRGGWGISQLKTLVDILVSLFLVSLPSKSHHLKSPPFIVHQLEEAYVPAPWRLLPWSLHNFIMASA